MPQQRQINLSSLRKCSFPIFSTVFETTSGSLKSASGSLGIPRVSVKFLYFLCFAVSLELTVGDYVWTKRIVLV